MLKTIHLMVTQRVEDAFRVSRKCSELVQGVSFGIHTFSTQLTVPGLVQFVRRAFGLALCTLFTQGSV